MRNKHQMTEEPDEVKVSRPVLETSGSREGLAEFNTSGKKIGTYVGRVAVRSTGSFNISTANGLIQGISHKCCTRVHAKDGYAYNA